MCLNTLDLPHLTLTCTSTATPMQLLLFPHFLPTAYTTSANHPLLKRNGRMESIKHQTSHNNHNTLKSDKKILLSDQMSTPALTKLRHSVHASPEYTNGAQRQRSQESLKLPFRAQRYENGVLIERIRAKRLIALVRVQGEVHAYDHKDEQRKDLEGETCDHDIVADIWILVLVRGGRSSAATCSLQQKTYEIAGDELPDISLFLSKGEREDIRNAYKSPA